MLHRHDIDAVQELHSGILGWTSIRKVSRLPRRSTLDSLLGSLLDTETWEPERPTTVSYVQVP